MKQLMFIEPGRAEWEEVPTAVLGSPKAALVRPTAVTTCALDVAALMGLLSDKKPFALGHEFIGQITEIGDDVETVGVGDRVLVAFQISCGTCTRCLSGFTANCEVVPKNSMFGLGPWSGGDYGGAIADLVEVPYADAMCLAISDHVHPAAASLSDNTTDAWRAVGPLIDEAAPQPVLVVGNGAIGVASAAIAAALGSEVTYLSNDPADRELASRFSVSVVELDRYPKRTKQRYPITVSSGGDPDALNCALRSTDLGGTCTDTGIFFEATTAVPLLAMYDGGVTLTTGRAQIRPAMSKVLELVNSNRLDPSKLIHSEADFDDADAAMSSLTNKLLLTRS